MSELAPAYDIIFAYNPTGELTQHPLMSVNGRFDDIRREDLMKVADRFSVPGASDLIVQVNDAVQQWGDFAAQAELAGQEIAFIAEYHTVL